MTITTDTGLCIKATRTQFLLVMTIMLSRLVKNKIKAPFTTITTDTGLCIEASISPDFSFKKFEYINHLQRITFLFCFDIIMCFIQNDKRILFTF